MLKLINQISLLIFLIGLFSCQTKENSIPDIGAAEDWAHYLGDYTSNQYSKLDQINKSNVSKLKLAWTYETGDEANFQSNNLVVNGIIYSPTPTSRVVALNGATGEEIWTFNPDEVEGPLSDGDQRGLMYWRNERGDRLFTMKGSYLFCLNVENGELVSSFGENGKIHLGDQMDVKGRPGVSLNTPGQIFKDMIIIGSNVAENVPGAVRAFDVRTGKRIWIFHTLPRPGEFGSETWPEDYLEKTGGASDWSGIAIDTSREMVFLSTETAGPDFYGGDRYGENLFANSIIALNANTGERIWHHQLVHHDLWDLDCPTPPTLLTVTHEGKKRDIVAQGTKMGLLFVFDRETGEPLWEIEERPTPESKLEDVKAWPTQPFPTAPPPLMRQIYTEDDISTISPKAELMTRDALNTYGSSGSYPAPSLEQTIMFPGYDGGMEWGGSAADHDGILYVNVNEIPWFYQLVATRKADGTPYSMGEKHYLINCASCHGIDKKGNGHSGFPSLEDATKRLSRDQISQFVTNGGGRMPAFDRLPEERREAIIDYIYGKETPPASSGNDGPPYVFRGFNRFQDDEGYPAIKPPWGTLNAVDLNTGTIKWKVPLGEYEELTNRGIPKTGTENYGGPVVTAGGLIFIAATSDSKIRVFDKDNGEELWIHDLPFDGHATPSVYMANGKQFVVISAGNSKMKAVKGGTILAFGLGE